MGSPLEHFEPFSGVATCPHECVCSCHQTGGVHVVGCCYPCSECGRNIQLDLVDNHAAECHNNPEAKKKLDRLSPA